MYTAMNNGSVQQRKDNSLDHLVLCFNQLEVYYLKKLEVKMEIWVITFLVIFQPKWFALHFTTQVQYPRGKSNCVWAHAVFGLD